MRVLHVVPSLSVRRGGPTEVAVQLARAQAAAGARVELVATRAELSPLEERDLRAALGPEVALSLEPIVGSPRLELSPRFVPLLARAIDRCDVAHVHTVFTFPVAIAPALCRRAGRPYVVRPAGTLDRVCLAQRSVPVKRLAIALWVRRDLLRAGAVHATSDLEAAELRALAPEAHVVVAGLGAEVAGVPEDRGGRGRRVGTLGRLHPIKNVPVLLAALARLPGDVELAIAGDGPAAYIAALEREAARLGVAGRVRFLGHVGAEARRDFLASCDVLAFPSAHESFGVAVAEALSAGRAVVVSPAVGLAPDIAAAGAGRVAEAHHEPFAAALAALLDDGDTRRRVAAAARTLARSRFGWAAAAERTLALYQEVAACR